MGLFSKFLGDPNQREIGKYKLFIEEVNALEPELEQKTNDQLKESALSLKAEIAPLAAKIVDETEAVIDPKERHDLRHKQLTHLLNNYRTKAYALVREASKRQLSMRHFDVQLIGGAVLHEGKVAEMQTGEGKTLVASLPLFLNALTGLGSHLVTVNDYLARRDAGWMGAIYTSLGLSVAVIGPQFSYAYDPDFINDETDLRLQHLRPISRRDAYYSDITYGTNNEFGFDYLRDNMAQDPAQLSQRELAYAIVDEVDSILIDEARTPLIISTFSSQSADLYKRFAELMPKLKAETDYTIDEKARSASLTDDGIKKLESLIGIANLYDPSTVELVHHADSALKAQALYKKNKDYVVKNGEVVIIDEFTGRMLVGRRYNGGLHQAIEAKEGVNVQQESTTLATITFQNYFRLYFKLAGMTGTAVTEAEELAKIYNLEVVSIPTNRPSQRDDRGDAIYKTEDAKYQAIANHVRELQETGQPVLIGTVSIAKSERLSRVLKANNIKHAVLNAKHHQKEGEVVAQAGHVGSVTVATNMAGRGVDIVLGGTPPNPTEPKGAFKQWEQDHAKVISLGGLFVLGTERHESRRIDNQLRGRAGRQGDPGVSQFYLSMEDDLMRVFGGDRMKGLMERLNVPDDMAINNSMLSRAIEQAQSRVEGHNFDIRKQLVEYDDVTNKQREAIYRRRQVILHSNTPEKATALHEEVLSIMNEQQQAAYAKKAKGWAPEVQLQVERAISLRAIDVLWVEHLKNLEDLRESIGLRGYGQRDPIVEYKQEAYGLYRGLESEIDNQIITMLTHVEVNVEQPVQQIAEQQPNKVEYSGDQAETETKLNPNKIGRNDPCPCGAIDPKTGKVYKYKKCGLINAPYHKR